MPALSKKFNSFADTLFSGYADITVRFTGLVCLIGVALAIAFSIGLLVADVERRDADTLWVDLDSRLVDEKRQFEEAFGGLTRKLTSIVTSNTTSGLLFDANDTSVQTTNALTALQDTMAIWASLNFTFENRTYAARDVCERSQVPPIYGRGGRASSIYGEYSRCLQADPTFQILYSGIRTQYSNLPANYTPLPLGWGMDEFPCSRASALDCFREGGEVDWPVALQQMEQVSGALVRSVQTTYSQLQQLISSTAIQIPGTTLTGQVGTILASGIVIPCWFNNVSGDLSCLETLGPLSNRMVNLTDQGEVNTAILFGLGALTDPTQGVLLALDSTGQLTSNAAAALNPLLPAIQTAGSILAAQQAAAAARQALLQVLGTSTNPQALLVASFLSLTYRLQSNAALGSIRIGEQCIGTATGGRMDLQGELINTALFFSSLGFWWRPSYRSMTQAEIVEHFNLAANAQLDPAVRADPTACITGAARCCRVWNGAVLGTSLFISGNARSQRRPVPNTGFTSLDLQSVTLVRSGWEDYHHNSPLWQDLLEETYPGINWRTEKRREDFARAFDQALTEQWLQRYERQVGSGFGPGEKSSSFRLDFSTGTALTEILEDASQVDGRLVALSYGVMAILILLSLGNYAEALLNINNSAVSQLAMVNSHGILGLLGLGVIAASSVAGLGFSAYVQITFNGLTINLVPFVSLGLGIDDMFVLAHTMFALNDRTCSVEENMRAVMCLAGPSVCLTSFANAVAFILVYYVPVGAIRQLVLVLMISVLVNLLLLLLIFVPLMVWDMKRNHANRMDVVFCKASKVDSKNNEGSNSESSSWMGVFIDRFYAPFLSNVIVKIAIIAFFAIAFALLLWNGIDNTKQGLRTSEIALRDTYQRDTAELTENVITIQKSNLITVSRNLSFNSTRAQQQILDSLDSLEQSPWIVQGTRIHDTHILSNSSAALLPVYSRAQAANVLPGFCPPADANTPINSSVCYDLFLPSWRTVFGRFFAPYVYCRNESSRVPCDSSATNRNISVTITRANYYFDNLLEHGDYLSAIKDVRQRVDPYSDNNVESFSIGYAFYFWEQYIDIEVTLIAAIGFGLLGVFVVTFLFQLNPWLSIIICLLILSIDIELIGFMRLIDVNLNPISVANLVISIGMAVEFTAHYARAFLLAQGTRDERMKVALHEMLQPMVNGALSTIIALSVLSLAEFPFFRRYYALTYVIMVLVSFINGLVLLPVILSLIGPPARDNTNKKLTQEVDAEGTNGIELH